MEDFIQTVLSDYGYLLYLVILAWTFLEGETVVIVTGAIASSGEYPINVELMAMAAFAGSFMGDQIYFYIGRRYGTPLLARWPGLKGKISWAFRLVRTHQTLFILSFRFIYGVRNVSPFVIGMSGVARLKYLALNFIAAMAWAHIFAWGGYMLGAALEEFMGRSKWWVLGGFVLVASTVAGINWLRHRRVVTAGAATVPVEPAPSE